jgi:hypothetical protein
MNVIERIRTFNTAHFTVTVDAIEEFDADMSWDEDGSVMRQIDHGELVLFCARVRVTHDVLGTIGDDYLGDCICETYAAFEDHRGGIGGSYFADMVRTAISAARDRIETVNASSVYIRS